MLAATRKRFEVFDHFHWCRRFCLCQHFGMKRRLDRTGRYLLVQPEHRQLRGIPQVYPSNRALPIISKQSGYGLCFFFQQSHRFLHSSFQPPSRISITSDILWPSRWRSNHTAFSCTVVSREFTIRSERRRNRTKRTTLRP